MGLSSWLYNRRGEWYVLVQIALMFAILYAPKVDGRIRIGDDSWPRFTVIAGLMLCVLGCGLALPSATALGRNLSPFPKPKDDSIFVERGTYSIVRHPIYSGLILFALGWGLAWSSIAALIGAVLLFAFFDFKARHEEQWLEEKFAGYAAYQRRVKKLIPFVY